MRDLTEREKLVFYGLCRWSDYSDIELSRRLKVKRSTVTAIRHKLKEKKYYSTIKVPDFQRIGCELLAVRYCDMNPLTTYWERRKYVTARVSPNTFFSLGSDKQTMSISANSNYTEIKEHMEEFERVYSEHNFFSDEGPTYVFFPLNLSRVFLFFDYASALRHNFNLKYDERMVPDLRRRAVDCVEFSDREKLVYYALIKYPDLGEADIAEKVGVTRQTVNNMRRKFRSQGLIKTSIVPDLEKLGYELLVLYHTRFNPQKPIPERMDTLEYVLNEGSHILVISGNTESVALTVHKSFTDLRRSYDQLVSMYREKDSISSDPTIRIHPLSDIKTIIYGRYAPLVKKVLGIKGDV